LDGVYQAHDLEGILGLHTPHDRLVLPCGVEDARTYVNLEKALFGVPSERILSRRELQILLAASASSRTSFIFVLVS
jgi:hypothetical protein